MLYRRSPVDSDIGLGSAASLCASVDSSERKNSLRDVSEKSDLYRNFSEKFTRMRRIYVIKGILRHPRVSWDLAVTRHLNRAIRIGINGMTGIGKSDDFVGLLCVCLENNLHIRRIYIQDHKIRNIDKKIHRRKVRMPKMRRFLRISSRLF